MTRSRVLLAAGVLVVLATGIASAYWSAPATSGSAGAAAAASINPGATPSANSAGTSVTVTWAASTLSSGAAVSGYLVKRYDAATMAPQTIQSACDGTVTATSCEENLVPPGRWVYSVTPAVGTSWRGTESAVSNPVWVDVTPPSNTISLVPVSGSASKSGDTVYYRGAAAGSFRLRNTVSDTLSGPASSTTAALAGTSTGWTHTPSTVSTPAGGPFDSNTFSWATSTTSSPTEQVTGRDAAGNTAATTLSFVDDSAGPTGGSVAVSSTLGGTGGVYSTSTALSLAFTKGTDAGAGVAATGATLRRSSASLTSAGGANGSCGTFGSYTTVTGGTDPTSPHANTGATGNCYRYQYSVPDVLGNSTTYTSADVKVDSSAPTAAPTLSFSGFANTWWSGTGTVVVYRSSAASGSFTVNGTASDTQSGIAGYTFPTSLGTNWSTTAGGTGTTTYSWSGSPAAPGTRTVSATNHAGLTSTNRSFSFTVDNAIPTGGTVSYTHGETTTSTITVTLGNATDAGSNVASRTLQRASAPLVNNACGAFGSFATIATSPALTYNDSVARDACYQYQYVVSDNVGNVATGGNVNIVKVQSYQTAVRATLGLLSHWRLGESTASYDTFTDIPGTLLTGHTGETGASWTAATGSGDFTIGADGRLRKQGNNAFARHWTSGVALSADYTVEADVHVLSRLTNDWIGVVGRLDPSATSGTFYAAGYNEATQAWTLYRVVNGAVTVIGAPAPETLTPGSSYRLGLDLAGSTIRLLVDGVVRSSATDATITSAGRVGVQQGNGSNSVDVTASEGMRLDDLRVTPPVTDGHGTNTGDYLGRPALGAAGAIGYDPDTAVSFDGVDDHAQVTREISDSFSIELWFKSTQGIGTGTSWTSGAGLVDADVAGASNDFGVSLRTDGRVVAGIGGPDTSVVSSAGGYNNGAWHHVVFTRNRSTGGVVLYVDGVQVGSTTAGTALLTSPATLDLGRIASGANYFAGALDEVAVYNTVMAAGTVAGHYAARQ